MLSGKVALVTGASRGIGREIAITLAGYGATVIVNYNGSAQAAQEVVDTIVANGGQARAVQASVAKEEDCKKLVEDALAEFGKIDILVNNAGITKDNLMMKITEEDYDAVMDTNVDLFFAVIGCAVCAAVLFAFLRKKEKREAQLSEKEALKV